MAALRSARPGALWLTPRLRVERLESFPQSGNLPLETGDSRLEADARGWLGAVDVQGLAVHATARVMAAASSHEVFTTAVTRALAEGVACRFEDRGEHQLKGLQQPLHLFAVEGADPQ